MSAQGQGPAPSEGLGKTVGASGVFIPPQYTKWEQPAGYFDGDGTVVVRVQMFTLEFGLQFADGYRFQLDQLKSFFEQEGLVTGSMTKHSYEEMYVLRISDHQSVLITAENMLPYSSKKAAELAALVGYMTNQITGNQAVETFNRMVNEGERIGKIRIVNMPYTHKEGVERAHASQGFKLAKLTYGNQAEIQERHTEGESVRTLAKEFKVSVWSIRKALHGGYRSA